MKKSIRKKNKKFIEPSPEIFQSLIYLYSNGDLQGTLNKAKTLLKEYPDSPTLYNICGITYSDLDKHEEALDNFYLALQINPNYADCHYNKGNTLQACGNLGGAIKSFSKCISIDSKHFLALNNKGILHRLNGELDLAVQSLRKAIQIKPDYPDAHYNLGLTLEKLDLDKAIVSYKKCIELRPNFGDAYNNLGNILKNKGEIEASILRYIEAIRHKPNSPEIHCNLGYAFFEKHDFVNASEQFKYAIEINPNYDEPYSGLGECYLLMGQEAKGRELIRQSNGVIRFSNDSGSIILGSNINAAPPAT